MRTRALALALIASASVHGFSAPATAVRPAAGRARAVRMAPEAAPDEGLAAAYMLGGGASTAAWSVCAWQALATYKPWRVTHNTIGVAQALTALPLLWAVSASLAAAARDGRLRRRAFRRLNLGLAAASLWSAAAVFWAPAFTSAVVRTADPVALAPALRAAATAVHVSVAALCLGSWQRSGGEAAALVPRVLGSLWELGPRRTPAEPSGLDGGRERAAEYAALSIAFGCFSAFAAAAPFPLATVPSLLGKRLARAFGAWTWLAAVVMHVLKCAADSDADGGERGGSERGEALDSFTSACLRRGVLAAATAHLAIALARPALESAVVYPAAMACRPAVAASLLAYTLAVAATW